jgi:uncharacterized protein YndB with AHSA1/START domain
MTDDAPSPITGSLRSEGDAGVVRLEGRYDTDIDDLWEALTDPVRLARWYGDVAGDLRLDGRFRIYNPSADIESMAQVAECEPPRRLRVTSRETEQSYRRGQGVPPHDTSIDVTLTSDGDQTLLALEVRGMPLDKIAFFGAGWHIHAENLASHVAGADPGDVAARWEQLVPHYQDLAGNRR